MREQCSQLARLRVFPPKDRTGGRPHARHRAHRSVSGRTFSSNPSEASRQGEPPGSEGRGPRGKAMCPDGDGCQLGCHPRCCSHSLFPEFTGRRARGGSHWPLLPFSQAGEVLWRMTIPLPRRRPLRWVFFDIKSKSGIQSSRGIVVSF